MARCVCTNYVQHNLLPARYHFEPTGKRANTSSGNKSYLLATGGNDSLVKLWQITICSRDDVTEAVSVASKCGDVSYDEKKSFTGHGGNVTCVRFSPLQSDILGSVATDRTARVWSAVS